jgi:hypothetical protein
MFNSIFVNFRGQPSEWLSTFFSSVSAPPAFYAQFTQDPGGKATGALIQLSMLQANDLRSSLLRAHGAYAVQLMYNGGQGYSASDGSHGASFLNNNVTAFEATTVLQSGVMAPIYPAVLLAIWASGFMLLGILYGFRRRWAPTLDGWSLFVFGVDLLQQVKKLTGLHQLGVTLEYENARVSNKLSSSLVDLHQSTILPPVKHPFLTPSRF